MDHEPLVLIIAYIIDSARKTVKNIKNTKNIQQKNIYIITVC